jgi:hypothetical protein
MPFGIHFLCVTEEAQCFLLSFAIYTNFDNDRVTQTLRNYNNGNCYHVRG